MLQLLLNHRSQSDHSPHSTGFRVDKVNEKQKYVTCITAGLALTASAKGQTLISCIVLSSILLLSGKYRISVRSSAWPKMEANAQ